MNRKYIYMVGATAFCFAVIFYFISWFGFNVPKFNYQVGDIAHTSIRAPFAFNVLKPDRILEAEATRAIQNYPPIYRISEEINFNTLRRLDSFFIELNNVALLDDPNLLYTFLEDNGLAASRLLVNHLLNTENRNRFYNLMIESFSYVMALPIVNDVDRNKVFRISDHQRPSENLISTAITKNDAEAMILRDVREQFNHAIIVDIIGLFLDSNLVIDIEAMNAEKEHLKRNIDPIVTRIDNNEYIIIRNERITEQDILKLESLRSAMIDRQNVKSRLELFVSVLGHLLYNAFLLLLFYYLTKIFYRERFLENKKLALVFLSFIASVLIAVLLYHVFNVTNVVLIPIPMFVLIMAIIFNASYGLVFSFFAIIFTGQYLEWNMLPLINLLVASTISLLVIRQTRQVNYLLIFLYMLSSLSIMMFFTTLYRNESFTDLVLNLFYCFVTSLISVVGASLLVPKVEKVFEIATRQNLLDLMDYNNPLMKRLAKEAQGTYYHSLVVGNLAEACAEAISANSMIARVSGYYHDIGKLEQPDYFSENILGENKHDEMNPVESALIIKNHVKNGLVLAKKAKLPKQIIDIILQHHGDSRIKYFLHKANEMGIDYEPDVFLYAGPKPKTKEAVIVMIADMVESTTKSSYDQSEANIKKIIEDTVNNLLADEQLIDAPISIRDLEIIKKTMLPILCSIHRKRVEYPKSVDGV